MSKIALVQYAISNLNLRFAAKEKQSALQILQIFLDRKIVETFLIEK